MADPSHLQLSPGIPAAESYSQGANSDFEKNERWRLGDGHESAWSNYEETKLRVRRICRAMAPWKTAEAPGEWLIGVGTK
jgi:hypothetical protein